jgi:serine/threonine-protein kinase HipA
MRLLDVHYAGWGEDWRLGQLAEDGDRLLFEYAPEALAQRLELSPLHLRLRAAAYGGFPNYQLRLPGLIADALPDGWGLLLMDRVFRQLGVRNPSALERLALLGERAIGALRFLPASPAAAEPDWDLRTLAEHSAKLESAGENQRSGQAKTVLRQLLLTGGSPQGARPKALVHFEAASGQVSTRSSAAGLPWLIKFPARGEHREVCAIERLYLALAADCGIETPASQLFAIAPKMAAIGLARFDREGAIRVPIQSLASLLHADFRQPGSVDYLGLLRATRALTMDEREVEKAFQRAVFNALFHNRDDHPKNVAFRLGRDRRWRLAPAFDLTFGDGPGGQHHMDFAGVGSNISRAHLMQLASGGGVATGAAKQIIDRLVDVAQQFTVRAQDFPIRKTTVRSMASVISGCVAAIA